MYLFFLAYTVQSFNSYTCLTVNLLVVYFFCIMSSHSLVLSSHEMFMLFSEWDADFATKAYRQQVETLAQHQVRLILMHLPCPFIFQHGNVFALTIVDGRFGK